MRLPEPDSDALSDLLRELRAAQVGCALGDFGSLARGKRVAAAKFIAARGCRMPTLCGRAWT